MRPGFDPGLRARGVGRYGRGLPVMPDNFGDANPLESLGLGSGHEGRALLLRLRYVAQSCDDERSLGRPVPASG